MTAMLPRALQQLAKTPDPPFPTLPQTTQARNVYKHTHARECVSVRVRLA